ncbi:MAG: hypothetical protein ACI8QS_001127 [Planctomycetota bacterium]|jgi:hypothetical protein
MQNIQVNRRLFVGAGLSVVGSLSSGGKSLLRGGRLPGEDSGPLSAKEPHFKAKAKRVIFLCMRGAPSHMDTFDHKPELSRANGKKSPVRGQLMGSPWAFQPHGESGLEISELFPKLAAHADELCLINSMHCDQPNHPQAQTQMHTGTFRFQRPSLGSWLLYGLGTENQSLPGFLTIAPSGGVQNYGSAFLPAIYQGTKIDARAFVSRRGRAAGDALPDLSNPQLSASEQRAQLDLIQSLNRGALKGDKDNPNIEGVIDSYELAFLMQEAMPAIMKLEEETDETRALYGIDQGASDAFGRQCLGARRMLEAGVRFVQVTHGNWDHHRALRDGLAANCNETDGPIAGLLEDMKRRGLLEDTLVIWGGEFGRTPHSQNGDGRDHNHQGYSTWMAGAGVRGGMRHGATDELGYEAVEDKMHIHDWHATILHLLGLDHEQLTYPYAGREFRLTDVYGRVHREVLS